MPTNIKLAYRTVRCPTCGGRVSFWTLANTKTRDLERHVGEAHHVVERASHVPVTRNEEAE